MKKIKKQPKVLSTREYFSVYLGFYSVVEEVACKHWLSTVCQRYFDDGGMPGSDNTMTYV